MDFKNRVGREMADSKGVVFAAILAALGLSFCGGIGVSVVEGSETPGEPTSFYGPALEANGSEIPAGTRIVAVVDGGIEGEITVETPGKYGGSDAFDDKLRVDSTTGENVTFRLTNANGAIGANASLDPGIYEQPLTFPNGSVERRLPDAAIDIDPAVATTGESVALSAADSDAYNDTGLVGFEWSIDRGDGTTASFDGKEISHSIETAGEYDVALTVTDTEGRMATEQATLEIESDDTGSSNGDSTGGGGGGGSGGGLTGGGGATGDSGSTGESSEEAADSGSDGTDSSSGSGGSGGPIRTERRPIDDQFPNAPGATVVFDETAVREVVLEDRSADGEISIAEFEEPTDGAPPIPGNRSVVSASEITVPKSQRSKDAILRAVVSEEWLAEHGIAPSHLTVYRLPDGGDRWEPLPTETFDIDGGYAVEAQTPGFSQFVVAGRQPPSERSDESTPAETEPEISAERSDQTTTETQTEEESSESTDTEDSPEDDTDRSGETSPLVLVASLCAIFVFVAAVGHFFIPRRRDDW
jgi:PGF-pre-PGF domain-containing protein